MRLEIEIECVAKSVLAEGFGFDAVVASGEEDNESSRSDVSLFREPRGGELLPVLLSLLAAVMSEDVEDDDNEEDEEDDDGKEGKDLELGLPSTKSPSPGLTSN